MKRKFWWMIIVSALTFASAAIYVANYYLHSRHTIEPADHIVDATRTPPSGWNNFEARLLKLEFFYPAQWGKPEENLTAIGDERQYILSFDRAPTIFAGSLTDGFTGFDPNIVEVAVSRTSRKRDTLSMYIGDQKQYDVTEYKVIKSTRAGDVGLGQAPPPDRSGFETGDRVGVVYLADSKFRVLVFHFHQFASDQEVHTLLKSVLIP